MGDRHHVVLASWEQGRRHGEPYVRLYEARCDPCGWKSKHTDNDLLARTWAADHQGIARHTPDWQRGPLR